MQEIENMKIYKETEKAVYAEAHTMNEFTCNFIQMPKSCIKTREYENGTKGKETYITHVKKWLAIKHQL